MQSWQLQEAKNKLSEVVERAITGEPQTITRHGQPVVVVLSVEEYHRLASPRMRFIDALRTAPAGLAELDFGRDPSPVPEPIAL